MLFPKSMLDHVCVVSRCILKRLKPNTDLVRKTFAAKETLIGRAADIVLVAVGKKLEPRNLVPTFFLAEIRSYTQNLVPRKKHQMKGRFDFILKE